MNPTARILLLFGALFLLVFGIVCLKQRLGSEQVPPAFVPAGTGEPMSESHNHRVGQPTILSPEPSSEHGFTIQPELREFRPTPLEDQRPSLEEVPVRATLPEISSEPAQLPDDSSTESFEGDSIPAQAAATLQAPIEITTTSEVADSAPPTSVMTVGDDSFWAISERVYGRGEYYKALFLLNRSVAPRPDHVAAGIELLTPSIDELQRLVPEAFSTRGQPEAAKSLP
jgi:hypothetical protein